MVEKSDDPGEREDDEDYLPEETRIVDSPQKKKPPTDGCCIRDSGLDSLFS